MSATIAPPHCDMRAECVAPVTHIGSKGYTYCAAHAPARRGWESARKMLPWELRWLSEGRQLPDYRPGPEPRIAAPAPHPLTAEEIEILEDTMPNNYEGETK